MPLKVETVNPSVGEKQNVNFLFHARLMENVYSIFQISYIDSEQKYDFTVEGPLHLFLLFLINLV